MAHLKVIFGFFNKFCDIQPPKKLRTLTVSNFMNTYNILYLVSKITRCSLVFLLAGNSWCGWDLVVGLSGMLLTWRFISSRHHADHSLSPSLESGTSTFWGPNLSLGERSIKEAPHIKSLYHNMTHTAPIVHTSFTYLIKKSD